MRKEFIIAIISGITIGIIVAFGIWRANTALKSENSLSLPEANPTQNTEKSPDGDQMTIMSPEEDDVITASPIKVSGITNPNITLAISAEQKDYIIKTSEDGSFEQEIDLVGGVNEILIAQSGEGNITQLKSLRVVYSSEFEKEATQ